ncbi:MAG: transporter [Pirellulales bacterium]
MAGVAGWTTWTRIVLFPSWGWMLVGLLALAVPVLGAEPIEPRRQPRVNASGDVDFELNKYFEDRHVHSRGMEPAEGGSVGGEGDDDEPNISEPGPDMGDFPNSAFTLPKGRAYIEMAPATVVAADSNTPAAYVWPFLLRYGLTDDVEVRLLGNGLTALFGENGTTGFSPLTFDMKIHLWDHDHWWMPAASLEAYILSTWGSSAFQGGTQPSLNMNFDLPLTRATNLEWTLGLTGVENTLDVVTGERYVTRHNFRIPLIQQVGVTENQFSAQWAIEHQVTERLQLFLHGYYNGAIFLQQGAGNVAGAGFFWKSNSRLIYFGSCNAGLDNDVAPISGQFGFAVAF